MGEARRRRPATGNGMSFVELDATLRRLGIETQQIAFYDQPPFLAFEQANPTALEEKRPSWGKSRQPAGTPWSV